MKRIYVIFRLLGTLLVIVALLLSSGVLMAYSAGGASDKPLKLPGADRGLIMVSGAVFLLLVVFIIVLIHYLGKISRMKAQLQESNEELIESGNKLRQQYDELTMVQRQLLSSEERYSLLFERILNGFSVFEPIFDGEGRLVDLRFLKANPGLELQAGLDSKEIIGKTWMDIYKYPNKNLDIYHRILLTGEPEHFETYYEQSDTYYLTNAFKISDSQIGTVFENVTEYKQAIRKITILNEELERRVEERTEELQSAVNELEAFTYTVSHDLKSPLRAIDGYSRIIMEDYGPELGEEASGMLQNIRNIALDMIEMINKLLQYSTTAKAPLNKEKIDIGPLVNSIFTELLSANPDRDIKLNVETELPAIYADRVMIRQVIYNLLSNAVKFTRYEEQAVITAGCSISGEEYIFNIKDNGVGFDMDYSGKLFGIFQRLHTADEFEGSGIGLVTVKKIIHRHGGRVWIKGSTGQGAEVYFTLPVA